MSGYILALLSGTFAGFTVAIGKMASVHLPAAMYVFIMSIASLVMTLAWQKTVSGWRLSPPEPAARKHLVWHILFSALAMWTFWEGTKHMEAARASFSVRVELVFVLIAGRLWFHERLTRAGLFGAFLIIVGTAIMGANMDGPGMGLESVYGSYGFWLMMLSGLAFAGAECFANVLAPLIAPASLVIWRSLSLLVIFGVMAVSTGTYEWPGARDIFVISLASLFGPVLARICFMFALRKINLSMASLLSQTEPVVTTIVAWVLMGEMMRPVDFAGAAAILAGCIALNAQGPSSSPHPH